VSIGAQHRLLLLLSLCKGHLPPRKWWVAPGVLAPQWQGAHTTLACALALLVQEEWYKHCQGIRQGGVCTLPLWGKRTRCYLPC
jgi:hypothetical protein